jgi:DNA mismatch endonuclease (patch repair protein)
MTLPYPVPSSAAVTALMRGNRKAGTRPELHLRSALHRRGLRFRVLVPLIVGGIKVRPDVTFPRWRVAVFIDGCFWHRCPEHGTAPRVNLSYWGPKLDRNEARDRLVTEALLSAGWRVVRVWEHELVDNAAARIETVLASAKAEP